MITFGTLYFIFILVLSLAETLHTIFLIHVTYTYSIDSFGDFDAIQKTTWCVSPSPYN